MTSTTENELADEGTYSDPATPGPDRTRATSNRTLLRIPFRRLFVWLLFSVVFGLFPIIAAEFKGLTASKGFNFGDALSTGELFVVSAVLSAGAMEELFSAESKEHRGGYLRITAGFCGLFCFCANTMAFMEVGSTSSQLNTTLSVVFFIVTTMASAVCIGASGEQ
jgi:hypothetical protein